MPTLDPQFQPLVSAATSETSQLDTSLVDIIQASPLPSLGPGPEYPHMTRWLKQYAHRPTQSLSTACLAGLWLLAGDLDASHELSQSDHTAQGSFWHGIMHRREGDFSNAKYWFRRVGRHPVFDHLASTGYGDPYQFVDRCEHVDNSAAQALMTLQWLEWQSLFFFCLSSSLSSYGSK